MKKSMVLILALALSVACSVQAANMLWNVSAVTYSGQSEDDFWNVGFTGTLWLLDVTAGTAGISAAGGVLTLGSASLVDTLTGDGSGGGVGYYNTINTATAGNSYMVVGYDSVGNLWGQSQVIVGAVNPAFSPDLYNTDFYNGSNPFDTGNALILATPEPTSLALLAVGAATLGLRRKFRK